MLYALGFIGLFTMGGMTGLFRGRVRVDVHVTDTYFIIAHFHYIMVGGMVMAYLGGMHFWWPKITGRMYPEGWASSLRYSSSSASISPSSRSSSWATWACQGATGNISPEFQVLERALHGGCIDPGGRLPAADGVFLVVDALWKDCRRQPLGCRWPGMDDDSPPTTSNFDEIPTVTWEASLRSTQGGPR